MATIATFTLPVGEFPLGDIFSDHPDLTVELERVVPTTRGIIPYFWLQQAEGTDRLEIDPFRFSHVATIEVIDTLPDAQLVRAEWVSDFEGILRPISECNVALISGTGTSEGWAFEIRADRHEDLATFQEKCRENGLSIKLQSVQSLSEAEFSDQYNLTENQREALVLAYERGYFRSPREVTLEELGDELGITGQSVGSRLRRGTHRLIGATIGESK